MAGNDQDINQMTSVPQPMGEGDTSANSAFSYTLDGGRFPSMGAMQSANNDSSNPAGGLATLASSDESQLPVTSQSAFGVKPNQNYLDQLSAIQNEVQRQTNSSQVPWFQLASAFLNPGRTGSFGESLGGAAGIMGKYQEEQQARRLPLMQAGLKAAELKKQISSQELMGQLYTPVKDASGNTIYKFNPEKAQQLIELTGDPKYVSLLNEETQRQRTQELKGNLFQSEDGAAGFNTDAFKKLYALNSKEALETVKAIPEMRRYGLIPSTGAEDTPFDVLAMMAKDPIIKQQAVRDATSFRNGTMTQEAAEKRAQDLLKLHQENMTAQQKLEDSRMQHGFMNEIARGRAEDAKSQREIMNELAKSRGEETKRMHDYQIAEKDKAKEDALAKQEATLSNLSNQVSTVRNSPGRGSATFPVAGPFISMLPKTDALEFSNQMKTLKSQQFLSNIQGMKGMGSLSNAEGEKVMNLITSLDPQMSKPAFDRALDQIDKFVQNGMQNIQRQRKGEAPKFIESDHPSSSSGESKILDFHDLPKKAK